MLVSFVWAVMSLLAGGNALVQQRIFGGPSDWHSAVFWIGEWLLVALLTPAVFFVSRRVSFTRGKAERRTVQHMLLAILFCAIWALGGCVLRVMLHVDSAKEGYLRLVASAFFGTLPFGSAVYLGIVGIE